MFLLSFLTAAAPSECDLIQSCCKESIDGLGSSLKAAPHVALDALAAGEMHHECRAHRLPAPWFWQHYDVPAWSEDMLARAFDFTATYPRLEHAVARMLQRNGPKNGTVDIYVIGGSFSAGSDCTAECAALAQSGRTPRGYPSDAMGPAHTTT